MVGFTSEMGVCKWPNALGRTIRVPISFLHSAKSQEFVGGSVYMRLEGLDGGWWNW
jgi:hypothetical protein